MNNGETTEVIINTGVADISTTLKPHRTKLGSKTHETDASASSVGKTSLEIVPKTDEPKVDILSKQQPVLQALKSSVFTTLETTKKAGHEMLVGIAKCGLALQAAKKIVGHGNFEKWFKAEKFEFSDVSRCKYMRFAECLCESGKIEPGLLLNLASSEDGKSISVIVNENRVGEIIKEVCQGKHLSELYLDWGIKKLAPPKAEKTNHQAVTDNGKIAIEDVTGRLDAIVADMALLIPTMQPEKKSELVATEPGHAT